MIPSFICSKCIWYWWANPMISCYLHIPNLNFHNCEAYLYAYYKDGEKFGGSNV
jgi:hypothetical protein